MTKPLPTNDFRAVRIILEPDDFAITDGKPDVPTDLIDEETWRHITMLPDDVAIRTSNHQGRYIRELNDLNAIWVEHAVGYEEDILHEVLIYTMDELDSVLFNAIHGYYRQSIGCLRNVLELVLYGTLWQVTGDNVEFNEWVSGTKPMSFGNSCEKLSEKDRALALEAHLRGTISDSLFNRSRQPDAQGWVRRLYDELCHYSHSRPQHANTSIWRSNGPIYVKRWFNITYSAYYDVIALSYILVKLARPDFKIPDKITSLFRSYRRKSDKVPYESYKFLFGRSKKK